jgi:hypothetical protein
LYADDVGPSRRGRHDASTNAGIHRPVQHRAHVPGRGSRGIG